MPEVLASTFVLAVRDLATSKRFYMEKLGFAEDFSVDGWAFLSRGACKLRLGHCPDAIPMPRTTRGSRISMSETPPASTANASRMAWTFGTRLRTSRGGCVSLPS
jgi:hypothetical protein